MAFKRCMQDVLYVLPTFRRHRPPLPASRAYSTPFGSMTARNTQPLGSTLRGSRVLSIGIAPFRCKSAHANEEICEKGVWGPEQALAYEGPEVVQKSCEKATSFVYCAP